MTRTLPLRRPGPPALPDLDRLAPLSWTGVGQASYLLHQRVTYSYPEPVRHVRQELRLVPPAVWGDQVRTDHGVTVTGAAHTCRTRRDRRGNTVTRIEAPRVELALEFDVWATIERRFGVQREARFDRRFLTTSPLTRPDRALCLAAAGLAAGERPSRGLAEQICSWVHQIMTYQWGITGVHTSAAEALALGVGVCQDYSHIMLAMCRLVGLPARYVSGHLIGEGGSHAWVDVAVPDAGGASGWSWVGFDPTHDSLVGPGYLTVATGRDYGDVAPLSGSCHGSQPGRLTVTKRVAVIEVV